MTTSGSRRSNNVFNSIKLTIKHFYLVAIHSTFCLNSRAPKDNEKFSIICLKKKKRKQMRHNWNECCSHAQQAASARCDALHTCIAKHKFHLNNGMQRGFQLNQREIQCTTHVHNNNNVSRSMFCRPFWPVMPFYGLRPNKVSQLTNSWKRN